MGPKEPIGVKWDQTAPNHPHREVTELENLSENVNFYFFSICVFLKYLGLNIIYELSQGHRKVPIPRTVTIHLQPFLPYLNLPVKKSYWIGIWLSNIITGRDFC